MELSVALARMLWLYEIRAKDGDKIGEGGPRESMGEGQGLGSTNLRISGFARGMGQ
jgi:hypothetical protein